MKPLNYTVLVLSCVLFVFHACGHNNKSQSVEVDTTIVHCESDIYNENTLENVAFDETDIVSMLKEFYTLYITECDKMPLNEQNIMALKNKYFTSEFLTKWDDAELDYDPVVNAQDYDQNWIKTLEINPVAERNNTYRICYHYDAFDGERTNCVILVLVEKNEKYLINDIENVP